MDFRSAKNPKHEQKNNFENGNNFPLFDVYRNLEKRKTCGKLDVQIGAPRPPAPPPKKGGGESGFPVTCNKSLQISIARRLTNRKVVISFLAAFYFFRKKPLAFPRRKEKKTSITQPLLLLPFSTLLSVTLVASSGQNRVSRETSIYQEQRKQYSPHIRDAP